MLRINNFLITTIVFLALFSFAGISDAIDIMELTPQGDDYEPIQNYNQYLMHNVYMMTDVPFSRVEWYVDDVLKETTSGNGVKTEATFQPWFLIGSDASTDFEIKAIAYEWDGDGSDTDKFTLTVFSPFQIVKMKSNDGSYEDYNYGDPHGIWHKAFVETSEPYYIVQWYVNDVFREMDFGDGVKTGAYFWPYWIPGAIRGETYTIKAEVFVNNDADSSNDTDSYELVVYAPMFTRTVETPPQKNPSVSGYAELKRQYYDGNNISIDCYVVASNSTNTRCTAWSRFRHTLTGRAPIVKDDPIDADGNIVPQRIGYYSRSETLTHPDIGTIDENQRLTSTAYIRLVVHGPGGEDHWFIENTEEFTDDDNIVTEEPESSPPLQPTQWGAIKQGP